MLSNIKDIGSKLDKVLVFGGVYSNLQALQSLHQMAAIHQIAPDHIICTGDIVGYCAQPSECIDFIQGWGIHSILGNVEQNLLSGQEDCGCNFAEGGKCDLLSQKWYPYVSAAITASNKSFLSTLPNNIKFNFHNKVVTVVHGSINDIAQFIFKSTDWNTKDTNFIQTNSDIILAGHSGIPFADHSLDKLWLNAGVIGMPANDGTTDTWYMILDTINEQIKYSFHRLRYDHETAAELMLANHLPIEYSATLKTGIWDNCEILPETEKMQQGKKLDPAITSIM